MKAFNITKFFASGSHASETSMRRAKSIKFVRHEARVAEIKLYDEAGSASTIPIPSGGARLDFPNGMCIRLGDAEVELSPGSSIEIGIPKS